jgi:hypothetical protein
MSPLSKDSPTEALVITTLMALGIFWLDSSIHDDYGIASLYVMPIILSAWYSRISSGWFLAGLCVILEIVTNFIVGAYASSLHKGNVNVIWVGAMMHLVGYAAVVIGVKTIAEVLAKEESARQAVRDVEHAVCAECKKTLSESGAFKAL